VTFSAALPFSGSRRNQSPAQTVLIKAKFLSDSYVSSQAITQSLISLSQMGPKFAGWQNEPILPG
jgi:hypothetical protein